jgi:RNA polymerase-binding transcription factor DksA
MNKTDRESFDRVHSELRAILDAPPPGHFAVIIVNGTDDDAMARAGAEHAASIEIFGFELRSAKHMEAMIAHQRLHEGTYGICVDCSKEIAPERLRAVPWAVRCVRCQEKSDSERAAQVAAAPRRTIAVDNTRSRRSAF